MFVSNLSHWSSLKHIWSWRHTSLFFVTMDALVASSSAPSFLCHSFPHCVCRHELCDVPSCFKHLTVIAVPMELTITGLNDYRSVALMSVVVRSLETDAEPPEGHQRTPCWTPWSLPTGRTGWWMMQWSTLDLQHLDSPGTYAWIPFVDFSSAFNPEVLKDKRSHLTCVAPPHLCGFTTPSPIGDSRWGWEASIVSTSTPHWHPPGVRSFPAALLPSPLELLRGEIKNAVFEAKPRNAKELWNNPGLEYRVLYILRNSGYKMKYEFSDSQLFTAFFLCTICWAFWLKVGVPLNDTKKGRHICALLGGKNETRAKNGPHSQRELHFVYFQLVIVNKNSYY